jgi:hypothetical protein
MHNSKGHGNTNVLSNLKRQVAIASDLLNASHPTKGTNTNKIGYSIANTLCTKRKLTVSSNSIGNGKKMKMPTSSALNAAKKGLIGTASAIKSKSLLKRKKIY